MKSPHAQVLSAPEFHNVAHRRRCHEPSRRSYVTGYTALPATLKNPPFEECLFSELRCILYDKDAKILGPQLSTLVRDEQVVQPASIPGLG